MDSCSCGNNRLSAVLHHHKRFQANIRELRFKAVSIPNDLRSYRKIPILELVVADEFGLSSDKSGYEITTYAKNNDESNLVENVNSTTNKIHIIYKPYIIPSYSENGMRIDAWKHLDDFLRGRIIGRLECGRTQLEVSEELGIAQSFISRLWRRFQDDGNMSRCYNTGRPRVTKPNEDRYIFSSYCQKKQTEHSIRPVSSALFSYRYNRLKADCVQTLRAHWSICSSVDECLQSEDITRTDWQAYSPDLNPIEHAWEMIDQRIAARQPPPTCLPELRRALLDECCNIPQDQIDNLILSMPRRCKHRKFPKEHSQNLVPEMLPPMVTLNAEVCECGR
ncbi:uncharacterized protein TNCV_3851 [Trichonephila clavipes]|nr:uncharacterized protein TNCV_3851 [Trichonephila clavipes]